VTLDYTIDRSWRLSLDAGALKKMRYGNAAAQDQLRSRLETTSAVGRLPAPFGRGSDGVSTAGLFADSRELEELVDKSELLAAPKSCPVPSTTNSGVVAGISFSAASISSREPKSSLDPWAKKDGNRNEGKCAVRSCCGFAGGWSGYDIKSKPDASSAESSAASIVACRPPYEWPPRNRRAWTPSSCRKSRNACRSPSRSAAASVGRGGPECLWRNGRSQRRTVQPCSTSFALTAFRIAAFEFEPAPCVSTRAWPAPPALEGSFYSIAVDWVHVTFRLV